MLNWIQPLYTRSRVNSAGKRIRDDRYTASDISVVENWRASHAYVLNTFQANLRQRSSNRNITVAQRLKRRPTIFDKLVREHNMQLANMHDIAGCRLIFSSIEELINFRLSLHNARFKHKLLNGDTDKYNYINSPKNSGYRGIHDVYEYCVSSTHGPTWNGLRIEIQYRTIYQHAWATAVEVADLITTNRIKFSESDESHKQFFRVASEIIARAFEDQHSCLPDVHNRHLIEKFQEIDKKLNLIRAFKNLHHVNEYTNIKKNTILIFKKDAKPGTQHLGTMSYDNIKSAIAKYEELESTLEFADIVLVRADNLASIRDAFRNYFTDTKDFIKYITEGCKILA
ncbi:MAG: RelA/SpoT domain-containing protein [Acidobacteriota bacterium]